MMESTARDNDRDGSSVDACQQHHSAVNIRAGAPTHNRGVGASKHRRPVLTAAFFKCFARGEAGLLVGIRGVPEGDLSRLRSDSRPVLRTDPFSFATKVPEDVVLEVGGSGATAGADGLGYFSLSKHTSQNVVNKAIRSSWDTNLSENSRNNSCFHTCKRPRSDDTADLGALRKRTQHFNQTKWNLEQNCRTRLTGGCLERHGQRRTRRTDSGDGRAWVGR
jgi:hypothetical protein